MEAHTESGEGIKPHPIPPHPAPSPASAAARRGAPGPPPPRPLPWARRAEPGPGRSPGARAPPPPLRGPYQAQLARLIVGQEAEDALDSHDGQPHQRVALRRRLHGRQRLGGLRQRGRGEPRRARGAAFALRHEPLLRRRHLAARPSSAGGRHRLSVTPLPQPSRRARPGIPAGSEGNGTPNAAAVPEGTGCYPCPGSRSRAGGRGTVSDCRRWYPRQDVEQGP